METPGREGQGIGTFRRVAGPLGCNRVGGAVRGPAPPSCCPELRAAPLPASVLQCVGPVLPGGLRPGQHRPLPRPLPAPRAAALRFRPFLSETGSFLPRPRHPLLAPRGRVHPDRSTRLHPRGRPRPSSSQRNTPLHRGRAEASGRWPSRRGDKGLRVPWICGMGRGPAGSWWPSLKTPAPPLRRAGPKARLGDPGASPSHPHLWPQ